MKELNLVLLHARYILKKSPTNSTNVPLTTRIYSKYFINSELFKSGHAPFETRPFQRESFPNLDLFFYLSFPFSNFAYNLCWSKRVMNAL